ncbi:MAG TPA: peptidylprolyl isomerase [Myxococcaceae bacterium]|jgi:peptidyl-prolyl cis-trans isomerase A (cyclophilin A)
MFRIIATTFLLAATVAGAQPVSPKSSAAPGKWTSQVKTGKDLFATLKTSQGTIVVRLFSKEAPRTVENFVALASGEKEWTNPQTGEKGKKPLYNGTVFHRVIPDFMIQGGDPSGTGRGNPGYLFGDEFNKRTFDKPGLLAMANRGPNTNGSQFFITTGTPMWLNNKHTIFGEVIQGYDVVEAISKVPRDAQDKPLTPVTLTSVTLSAKSPVAAAPKAPAPAPAPAPKP